MRLTSLGLMAVAGLATGIGLFSLTAGPLTLETISPPPCPQLNAHPTDIDPMTGQPYGYTFQCGGPGGATFHQPIKARQAVPVPLGFVVGAAAAGLVLLIDDRRRRSARIAGDRRPHS